VIKMKSWSSWMALNVITRFNGKNVGMINMKKLSSLRSLITSAMMQMYFLT